MEDFIYVIGTDPNPDYYSPGVWKYQHNNYNSYDLVESFVFKDFPVDLDFHPSLTFIGPDHSEVLLTSDNSEIFIANSMTKTSSTS